jgi:hypothetical protein
MTDVIEIVLQPGQRYVIVGAEAPAKVKPVDLHRTIIGLLKRGVKSADAIQEHVKKKVAGATTNAVAWALVELQNSTCRRSRSPDNKGPIEKTAAGYRLRA